MTKMGINAWNCRVMSTSSLSHYNRANIQGISGNWLPSHVTNSSASELSYFWVNGLIFPGNDRFRYLYYLHITIVTYVDNYIKRLELCIIMWYLWDLPYKLCMTMCLCYAASESNMHVIMKLHYLSNAAMEILLCLYV